MLTPAFKCTKASIHRRARRSGNPEIGFTGSLANILPGGEKASSKGLLRVRVPARLGVGAPRSYRLAAMMNWITVEVALGSGWRLVPAADADPGTTDVKVQDLPA